jgi:hyperosmotically inducible protein
MRAFFRLLYATTLLIVIQQAHAANLNELKQDLSDSVITTKITTKFTKDKSLNPLKILVSTDNGMVKLHGYVKDKQAFVDALRLAVDTKGVTSVDTEELEIKHVNTAFTDAYITAKIEASVLEAKVLDDESIPLVGINASTVNGVVTLSGEVKTNKAIVAILKRANAVRGVKKIISNLHTPKGIT